MAWRVPASRGLLAVLLVILWARHALPAPAEQYLGRRLVGVRLELEGRLVTDQGTVELVETRAGELLSMRDVRETIDHLYGLGRFQDIRVHATAAGDGVALRYELISLHNVREVVFRGPLGVSEGLLRGAVEERYGATPPVGRAADVVRTLTELYRDYGFLRARITPRTEVEHAPERTTLIFEIDAGPRTTIGEVEIEGNPLLPREQLLQRLDLKPGEPYERPAIDRRIQRYTDELRSRGYYEARIDQLAMPSSDDRQVTITLTAEPGPKVTVVFEGDPLPAAERERLVPIRREGSVDEDLLEDSERAIEEQLKSQGYRDADVAHSRETSDGELRIVFAIRRGAPHRIAQIAIDGNSAMTTVDLRDGPLKRARLEEGQPFVQSRLDGAASEIGEDYRRRGYADVKVNASADAETTPAGEATRPVAVRLTIAEGVRTLVGSVVFDGNRSLDEAILGRAIGSEPGKPFYRPQVALDQDGVLLQYLNRGYQSATVDIQTAFTPDRARTDLRVTIREGPQVFVDHILIVGNTRTSTETIHREITLRPGQPLGLGDIVESQRKLTALGLFRRVRITQLRHGAETRRDVLVSVEEAPPTTLGYGGGLEGGRRLRRSGDAGRAVERLELAPRGFFEIGRRNLWGKNRSVNLFTRVSLRSEDEGSAGDAAEGGGNRFGFIEYRVLGTYREPKVFGTANDALVTGFLEQAIRSSFNFSRRGARVEVGRRLTPRLSASGRYSFDRVRLFDEKFSEAERPLIDRLFPQVRLSALSSSVIRDTRDDAVDPTLGELVGLDGEVAARGLGSEVGFVKTFMQGFVYRRLRGGRRVVFAGGARLGLATAFAREVVRTDESGKPVTGPDGQPIVAVVDDLPASERFFAGGDTTVRGFALDRLGSEATIDQAGFPRGGNALLIVNAELRVPVWSGVGIVGFLDAGNVFRRAADLDFGEIRGAVGFGVRYRSPVGPIRIDLGFKLDRRRFASGEREHLTALHISLGQAF